jgi:hypothetical protein
MYEVTNFIAGSRYILAFEGGIHRKLWLFDVSFHG